jgi:hypothetical protein
MFVDVCTSDVRVSAVGTQRPQVRSLDHESLAAAVVLKRNRKSRQLPRSTTAGKHGQLLQAVEHDPLLPGQRQCCRRERVDPEPVVLSDVQPGILFIFSKDLLGKVSSLFGVSPIL